MPTTVGSDDFNRSNEDLDASANWTQINVGDARVVSNECEGATGNNDCTTKWVTGSFDDDQYSLADWITCYSSTVFVGVCTRLTGTGAATCDGYTFCASTANIRLWRLDDGSKTSLASSSYTFHSGDEMQMQSVSDEHELFDNGGSLGSVTDSTYASGVAGVMHTNNKTSVIDNWEGGNMADAAGDSLASVISRIKRQRAAYIRM